MAENKDVYDGFFRDDEGRKKAGEHLSREAKGFLAKYDAELVEEVRRRKQAGENLKQIYQDLGENPDVLDIAMHLAVSKQAEEIKGKRWGVSCEPWVAGYVGCSPDGVQRNPGIICYAS